MNRPRNLPAAGATAVAAIVACLAGCAVGPNYHRSSAPVTQTFKEMAGWTPSRPADALDKGAWWSMFDDPVLDSLEKRVVISNQTVKQYEAAYREAHELVIEARAAFFPTLSADASATRSRAPVSASTTSGPTSASSPASSSTAEIISNSFTAALEASWAPDLWGKIRRTVESNKALAQDRAAGGLIVISGSVYLVGEARSLLIPGAGA